MKRAEDQLQRAVITLLTLYERMGHLRYFAVGNGGKRNGTEASIMKGLGVRAGVPDIVCLRGHNAVLGSRDTIFFELKATKGRVSDKQWDWINWLNGHGHKALVVRSVDEVRTVIEACGWTGKSPCA